MLKIRRVCPERCRRGFTMIELLVVIAVIGVLAVAVLSAINPIEQINKGRDTGRRSDAGEVLSAIDRFYASLGWYPWETISATPALKVDPWENVDAKKDIPGTLILKKMVDTNEIKEGLMTRLTALGVTDKIKVYYHGDDAVVSGSSVYTCFKPKSKAFQTEAAIRCVTNNLTAWGADSPKAVACPATCTLAAPSDCYICLP